MPGFAGATKGTTTERGYGTPHQRLRAAAYARLPEYTPCARCHRTMWKGEREQLPSGATRSALHYDHNGARTGYIGFSCADCNRKHGAAQGGREVARRRANRRHPRPWRSRAW